MSNQTTAQRVTYIEAMQKLGCKRTKMDQLVADKIFTVQSDSTSKRARKYLLLDEIELYIEEQARGKGKEAVKQYRRKKRRI